MVEQETSYREYHERHLSGLEGTTSWEISLLLVASLAIKFLGSYIECRLSRGNNFQSFWIGYFFIAVPWILIITVFNFLLIPISTSVIALVPAVMLYELVFRESKVSLTKASSLTISDERRVFVTSFKSVASFLTIICILAVDFRIFPLKYAKTETFGYSLMDTGVGFFVVANGLTVKPKSALIKKTVVSNIPLLILGVVRFISVDKINYQRHVSEYGVHWNFYFTLGLVKVLGALLCRCSSNYGLTAVLLLCVHQVVLSLGVGDWVLSDAPRTGLVSANREGICSLPGYLSLYLTGMYYGTILLKSKPTVEHLIKDSFKCLVSYFFLYGLVGLSSHYIPPSRRLVNFTFASWMISLCLLLVSFLLISEVFFAVTQSPTRCQKTKNTAPFLLEAVCTNNLFFFLLCNLLTGLVNISLQTLFVPPVWSLVILLGYVFVASATICVMYGRGWKMKFW